MDRGTDCGTLAASALPLTLHQFPVFSGFCSSDPSLSLASVKAQENNDMMPIIKEELISEIQIKRVTEGKEGLSFDFTEKPKFELTAKERRRLQNKMAARRFREKQNTLRTKLQKKTQKFESSNTSLRNQIRNLRNEREILQRHLQEHLPRCHYVTGASIVTFA